MPRISKGTPKERGCPQCGLITKRFYPWNHAVCVDCKEKNICEDQWFCLLCNIRKSMEEFHDLHHSRCKECVNAEHRASEYRKRTNKSHRKWYSKNKDEQNRKRRDRWVNDETYREKLREYKHRKYWANPEKARKAKLEDHKRHRKERNAKRKEARKTRKTGGLCVYCGKRPPKKDFLECVECLEYRRHATNKRRGMGTDGYITQIEERNILERYGHICQLCGKNIDPNLDFPNSMSLSFDHIIPVTKGGPENEQNLWPTHLSCNQKKHTSLVLSSATFRAMRSLDTELLSQILDELREIKKGLKGQKIDKGQYPLFKGDQSWVN